MTASDQNKAMTSGEMGTVIALAALALLSLLITAKATDPGYVFHAALFTVASAGGIFFMSGISSCEIDFRG